MSGIAWPVLKYTLSLQLEMDSTIKHSTCSI